MSKRSRGMMKTLGHDMPEPPVVKNKPKKVKSPRLDYDSDGSTYSFTPSESGVLNTDFKQGGQELKGDKRMDETESAVEPEKPKIVDYSPSSVASNSSYRSNRGGKENSQGQSDLQMVKSRPQQAHRSIMSELQRNEIPLSKRPVSQVGTEIETAKPKLSKCPTPNILKDCSSNSVDGATIPSSISNTILEKEPSRVRRNLLPDLEFSGRAGPMGGVNLIESLATIPQKNFSQVMPENISKTTEISKVSSANFESNNSKKKEETKSKQADNDTSLEARNKDRVIRIPMKPKLKQRPLRIGLHKPTESDSFKKHKGNGSPLKASLYKTLIQKNFKHDKEIFQGVNVSTSSEPTINDLAIKSDKNLPRIPNGKSSKLSIKKKMVLTKKLPSRRSRTVAQQQIQAALSDCSSETDQSSDHASFTGMLGNSSDSSDEDDDSIVTSSACKPQSAMNKNKGDTRSESEDDPCEKPGNGSPPKLSPYQLMRQKNIKQNEEILQGLDVTTSSGPTSSDLAIKFKKPAEIPRRKPSILSKKKKITPTKELPSRRSRTPSDSSDSSEEEKIGRARKPQCTMNRNTGDTRSESEDDPPVSSPLDKHHQRNSNRNHCWSESDVAGEERENSDAETDEEASSPNEITDESDEGTPPAKMTKTARRAQQKELRNSGKRHTTRKGKVVAGRKRKRPHQCTVRKCHEIITPEVGDEIFREYWEQGSHDKRVAYVAGRIEKGEIQRKRSRKHLDNREKHQTCKYYLEIQGTRHSVCRSSFLNTLGETDRFVRTVVDNKALSLSGITQDDKRGKKTPPHALILTNKAEAILKHIGSYPAYVSHYCRAKSGDTKYLNANLSIAEMYRQYTEDPNNPTVSLSAYTNQFKLTGLKIHRQQTDGCDKCDTMDININASPPGSAERQALTVKKELHLRKAEKAYDLKRAAKLEAKTDPKKKVLVCDMEQCLPTPYLKCKKVYYKRQLYVLNYTVNDCSTNLTYNYMWNENEGHRGGNEVSSCLLKHILENVSDEVEELTIFSDCCSGQNRNFMMCMMLFIALQEHPSLKKIDYILLVPGHTFMPEVDTKHAAIEKHYKNYVERVNVPEEWYPIVEKAGQGKFKVYHMEEFLDIGALAKKELVKRAKCTDKEPFGYMKTHWFQYNKESLGMVSVKSNFNEAAAFRTLSFLRIGVRSDRLPRLAESLQVLPRNVPISMEKRDDLLSLLPYLEEKFHKFYQELPADANVRDYTA